MLPAVLTFSEVRWWVPAAGILALTAALLFWGYRHAGMRGISRWCILLKAVGVAALLFCLLEPLWSAQRAKPGSNFFAIVADNSQSLQIKDPGETRSRGETLRDQVETGRNPWLQKLGETFEVRRYVYDTRLQASSDFRELVFDGRASAMGAALRGIRDRFRGRPLAGVLLFTDGNATDIHGNLDDFAGLPPVYPVVTGDREPARDLAIDQIQSSQTAFEDTPASCQVDVTASGYRGETVVADLQDATGKLVESKSLTPARDLDKLTFRFRWKPRGSGLAFHRVSVHRQGDDALDNESTKSDEATLANNRRVLVVDRGHGPYRVLYVSGRPNWEFKFLNRAVQGDDQVQLVALIRVAKREPKFDFRGRVGETSNPLFRGFGNQSHEEVERYDQPVLVRLNTRDELELRNGFPKIPDDLYGYHAVIVDDLESEFFTVEQANLLQKFVSERGGGFLMLGGMESFAQGKYQSSAVGEMLPVYLDHVDEAQKPAAHRYQLTREGSLQPWARIRDNEGDERGRREAMPQFRVFNEVRGVKPGASVMAVAVDDQGKERPALVSQRFGRGRTAALMIGDLWRWGMRDPEARQDTEKTWRQLVRWLIADVPGRVEIAAEPLPEDPNGAMQLNVRVRNPQFQPQDDASVLVEVEPVLASGLGGTNRIRLLAEPSGTEAGLFQTAYVPRWTGGFKATAFVTNSVGAEVGRAETGWASDPAAEEFRSLTPNVSLLAEIARRTGGGLIRRDRLESWAAQLPSRVAPVMEAWTFPVWHTPVLLLLAMGCFCAEWGLRRWRGLP